VDPAPALTDGAGVLRPVLAVSAACLVGIAVLGFGGRAGATDPEGSGARWTTSVGSLTIGARDETATFREVRSTCHTLRLAVAFGTAAPGVRRCLPAPETRRVRLEIEDGRVTSSRADPDDDMGRCVTAALAGAQLAGLTCTLEANVSR
jgi:hypothetical protein